MKINEEGGRKDKSRLIRSMREKRRQERGKGTLNYVAVTSKEQEERRIGRTK